MAADRDMSHRYRMFRRFLIILCRIVYGFEVHGAENVPAKGPLIVAANHSQYSDPVLVCMAVPRRLQWMAKKELFTPLFRRFFYFIGSFPVDRQGGGRGALRSALRFLSDGWALGIFPEGTHRGGDSREAKSGAVMLAVRSSAPVLPVYVETLPSLKARLRGERHRIHIGKPMTMDNTLRGGRAYREAADELLRSIYALRPGDEKGGKG